MPKPADKPPTAFDQAFCPAHPEGSPVDTQIALRIAHALEYIAAQLGQINEKLGSIDEGDDKD